MPSERFYKKSPLENGDLLAIENEEFHHLTNVMRMKVGESLELVNGLGSLAEGKISSIEKKRAFIKIVSKEDQAPPTYELILLQAIPRQPRLECILEKAVELGVTKIWLFPGKLSEKKEIGSSHQERMHHILVSALKQCGRLFMPELQILDSLSSLNPLDIPCFFGDTRENTPTFLKSLLPQNQKSLLIAIGPEKGFHQDEVSLFETKYHMKGVHLHPNILRTDTAAICSLSLASAFLSQ